MGADEPDDDDLTYVQVTCRVCAQAHLVNPKTGKGWALEMTIRCAASAHSLSSPGFTP